MKTTLIGILTLSFALSLNANESAYFKGAMGQGYCNAKWTMTYWKEDANGKVCKELGKRKWINSCMLAYSKIDNPSREQITLTAKKQWKLK